MSSKIDELWARAQEQKNQPKPKDTIGKMKPRNYAEDFGNKEAEETAIEIMKNKFKGLFIKSIESGTKFEDEEEKVDYWMEFFGIVEPLGIQQTISDNEDKIEEKIRELDKKEWKAKKEKRVDSEINWSGTANVVLVRLDKIEIARIWKESKEKGVNPSEIADDNFVLNFYSQIFEQLGEINPVKKDILFKAFQTAMKRMAENKKRDKS